MAGADYSLNLSILGTNSAGAALSSFIGALAPIGGIIGGIGSNLANAFGNTSFALRNARTEGTLTSDAMAAAGGNIGKAMLGIGAVAAVAGVALAGVGVVATKEAADFQTAMLSNVAHAGLAKSEFQSVSNAILAMAPAVGRSPTQLADAMYPILSAFSGITNQSAKSKLALDTLKLSFEAVAGTTVDGTQVATAAVGTFNALGLATNNAATNSARMSNLMDIMDKTVQDGNMKWGAYQMVISKLATSIQGTGIKFTEASAALAVLTNSGMTARQSQTYLANMFTTMAIKTDAMAKHAKALGISWNAQAYAGMSLAQKVAYINQVTDGNKQKILALLGNNATALRSFNALSTGIKAYGSNLNDLNHAQGALKTSFDEASQGFNFQMSQVKAAGDALMITIGAQLLPVVSQFAKQLVPIVQQFTQWLTQSGALKIAAGFLADALTHFLAIIVGLATTLSNVVIFFQQNEWAMTALKSVLIAFALVVLPMVIAGLAAMASAAWLAAVPIIAMALPFIALGLVIAAVIFGIIEAIQHWGAIMDWISNKTAQTNIKIQISDSQAAVKKDQQQKKSAQDTLKNLEKEKADLLAKMKGTHDAATKAEYQKQLDMTQRQIDGQHQRIQQANADVAKQKAIQAKLHADLLESQKDWTVRVNDAVMNWRDNFYGAVNDWRKKTTDSINKWVGDTMKSFTTWRDGVYSTVSKWASDTWNRFTSWVGGIFSALGTFVHNFLSMLGGWKDKAIAKVQELIDGIKKFFAALPGQALQWGRDMIQGLINGITSMLGNLSNTASQAANQIASVLHFTHPSKGPLMTVEQWMPHLGDTLIMGLNRIAPQLQAAALRAAASVAGPIKGTADVSGMPSHIFDFIGSNYSGYSSGMATTAKREEAAQDKAARHAAVVARQENALDAHIAKLETHYNIVVHAHGKGKWTKADATELAKLLAEEARLQGKHPQTASGRRN